MLSDAIEGILSDVVIPDDAAVTEGCLDSIAAVTCNGAVDNPAAGIENAVTAITYNIDFLDMDLRVKRQPADKTRNRPIDDGNPGATAIDGNPRCGGGVIELRMVKPFRSI